tara:strand:+ start:547 stop:2892 length:2346 start_codon:yes stop_codon:yes gene_type:complete
MKTIDFVFNYEEEYEKYLLERILDFIKKDINENGGFSGKEFNYHLLQVDNLPDSEDEITKLFPNALFIQGDNLSRFADLESFFSNYYCLFFPAQKISKKLHKNVLSLGNNLCSDELSIEHLIVPSHKINKIWFFSNPDEYKRQKDVPPASSHDVFIDSENSDFQDKVNLITYSDKLIKFTEKTKKLPSSIEKITEQINKDDLVVVNAGHIDLLISYVIGCLEQKQHHQKILLMNDDPEINFVDMFVRSVGLESLNNLELISFSKNNDDLYLRMEEFIEKLNINWNEFNEKFPIYKDNFVSLQKNKINNLYVDKGLEISYLVKKTIDGHKLKIENRKEFLETILWGINRYNGINNKYLGLTANYSFIGNVNIEPSHFTYRLVPSSKDFSEYSNLLTSRLSENERRTIREVRDDEKVFAEKENFDDSAENEYYKLFHNVQLKTNLKTRDLLSTFDGMAETDNEIDEVYDGFAQVIEESYKNNLLISDINYVYFDILNISRISIEDKNWSVEFYLDLITKHDKGIEILQFDNLSKKDSLFETSLISKEEDVENQDLINFRYRISANFDFDAIPNNYPFDEQYLSISYSSSNTEKFGSIHPVPVRKIDNNFMLEGWDLLTSNAGISRTIDKKSVGSSLLQNANVKEVAKIGWKIKRGSSMTLFKILLPLSFLLALTYYSIFVPLDELGDSISILTTVFLASIALYFSTERPQPLSMTIVDLIFASFYSMTGITIIFTILVHLFNPLALFLLTPLKVLLPLSFVGLGIFIYMRIKSKRFSPSLTSD